MSYEAIGGHRSWMAGLAFACDVEHHARKVPSDMSLSQCQIGGLAYVARLVCGTTARNEAMASLKVCAALADRPHEGESHASTWISLREDTASVLDQDLVRNGEPQPSSILLGCKEGVKDLLQVSLPDALACVSNPQKDALLLFNDLKRDAAASRCCLKSVEGYIQQRLCNLLGITFDSWEIGGDLAR